MEHSVMMFYPHIRKSKCQYVIIRTYRCVLFMGNISIEAHFMYLQIYLLKINTFLITFFRKFVIKPRKRIIYPQWSLPDVRFSSLADENPHFGNTGYWRNYSRAGNLNELVLDKTEFLYHFLNSN